MTAAEPSPRYKGYVLSILTAVYTLNLMDRGLINLLLQPIKEDLHLSDSQLGLLTGLAFALFYATLGIPLGRWSDRGNRATIASLSIGLWSLTVMAALLIANYAQLVIARIAASVGEAGCKPPAYSLVGDYFPEADARTRALAVYFVASPAAALVSYIVGGWLNEQVGWRMTFFLMGIPGLFLALLVKLTVREPRTRTCGDDRAGREIPALRAVLAVLWRNRSARHTTIALTLLYMTSFGLSPWYAAFMIRSHGMGTAELGVWLGLIIGLSGIVGILLGSYVATRFFPHSERGQMRMAAVAVALKAPFFVAFLLLADRYQALLSLVPLFVVSNIFFAPTYSLLQRLVPDTMRATTLSVVMLIANLIGMGVGPQIVGILSDLLTPVAGADALRWAMMAMSFIAFWAAFHFWRIGTHVSTDIPSP
jgi:MFS family permease